MGAKTKSVRADGQMTGLAGELFVAAELLKRGLQTSITFGNAKAIDLLAHNPNTGRNFSVQVKAIRKKNVFPISHEKVNASHIYVFVVLNEPGESVQYFIVPGTTLSHEPERFTKWFRDPKFPGIKWSVLKDQGFENAWDIFTEKQATYSGRYTAGFEQSCFEPDGIDETWWASGVLPKPDPNGPTPQYFRIVVRGQLSPEGHYGHLDMCKRELTVQELVSVKSVSP